MFYDRLSSQVHPKAENKYLHANCADLDLKLRGFNLPRTIDTGGISILIALILKTLSVFEFF